MVYKWLNKVQSLLLPKFCLLCETRPAARAGLCCACTEDLPYHRHACVQCGYHLTEHQLMPICGRCLSQPPCYDQTLAAFAYQAPIDTLIWQLKYQQRLSNARVLATFLLEAIRQQQTAIPQALVPVPLHPQRLRERGFNQALELARPISLQLNIPIERHLCQRNRRTLAQSQVSASQREANMKQAFTLVHKHAYRHVAIIDDVMTTGHTVNQLARVLRGSGVEKIDVWCIARAQID